MNIDYEWSTPCEAHKKILVPAVYRFEVWGAQGGSYDSINVGGKGGYAKGEITLKNDTTVFVHVGGQSQTTTGGCNGGGNVASGYEKTAGGGGTDIRINTDSLYSRVIVAGGGGGSGKGTDEGAEIGGFGGGLKAGNGIYGDRPNYPGKGADESGPGTTCADGSTAGCPDGSFGSGGNAPYAGGGGGGWYGGAASRSTDPGGGGSGFVFVSRVPLPNGYLLTSDYYLNNTDLRAGNIAIPSFTLPSTTVTGNSGNGAARITLLTPIKVKRTVKCYTPVKRNMLSLIVFVLIALFVAPFDDIYIPSTKIE